MTNSEHEEAEVIVNGQTVRIVGRRPTGRHIKTSAIEQGVPMEPNFLLYEETSEGRRHVEDDEHLHLHSGERFVALAREVEILVNEKEVKIAGHRATGLEIKTAAIAQGVQITLDFVLSEELEERRSRVVGDGDVVHLHERSRFIAVAPDDNS